ncbi:toxin-antitoxin system YwqK family antitoxin [Flavobacterium restrictum]|uniref:Uncharacterized protein n=1 Tax=Flavobacterium restrictum TaxID=2594428 RepID=A0A553E472_9FLAO|nr:toxin-antitoxin system YwqK family antitoxin [Flavobacterium restrictum]TRX39780.1 hypothetical protein FNW21_08730 [Flavobacterium restrictum]
MKKIHLVLLLSFFIKSYSQTDYTAVYNNDTFINKGVALYDDEKYNEALLEFDKIKTIDPKYLQAQYEKALTLSALAQKEALKALFEKLYQSNKMPEFPTLYTLYGSYLSDEKDYDLAEKIFTEGQKYLSNSSNHLYNLAILYVWKEQPQKAVDLLEKIITNNPNHASSHYLLGIIALENGKITEGTLALMSYLVIAPNGRNAEKAILRLNAKFAQNYLTQNKLVFSKSGDNFEEIETILRNQLPLNPAYKVKSTIDDVVIRQVQAVVEYASEHKIGDGFFETTYIPWVKNLNDNNQFEPFSYYMLSAMEAKLGKQLTAQKKKVTDFNDHYLLKDFWSFYAKRTLNLFGTPEEVIVILKNRNPYLIGKQINGLKEGQYQYLDENGNLSGILNFKNDLLDGVQKYYNPKGNLTEEKSFTNGKLEGTRTAYYENGNVSVIENYKNDALNGNSASYYPNGGKQCEINFTNGERDGILTCLYENGSPKLSMVYAMGKVNGPYVSHNEVGDIKESSVYKNDLNEGDYVEYYDGKIKKATANYSNGKIQGSYKTYFTSSALEKENSYEAGKLKTITNYFPNGVKANESLHNDKEEVETYSYYDTSGNTYFEEKYKSGDLKSGLQYSNKKEQPVAINLTKNTFEMRNFKDNILVTGSFEKGKKSQQWNYFYASGLPKMTEFYVQGKEQGLDTEYYKNGLVSSIKNYTNDTLNGVYEGYENGILDEVYAYENGKQNGPYHSFYADGTLKTEGFFTNNELNYDKITYRQNGTIARKERYINNFQTALTTYTLKEEIENSIDYKNKTGKFNYTFYNGTISQEYEMVNGKLNEKFTVKDQLNTPIITSEYANGMLTNNYKSFSPLGTLYFETTYYCGRINGKYTQNDLVGNLRLTDENTFGEENGKTIRYYQNKVKMSEYNQLNGVLQGELFYYNQKGEAILAIGYTNNAPIYFTRMSKSGLLDDKIIIDNETADITSNYPNGKVALQMQLVKGNYEGKFSIHSGEGKPEFECVYLNNLLHGERIEYYVTGGIYKKENFIKNNFEGPQEYFKPDGKAWLTANYKNDEFHGNTLIYSEGKLILTKKYDSNELVAIIK